MHTPHAATQPLEATLFALKAISEGISSDETVGIPVVFGPDILGALTGVPNTGATVRVKRTALKVIGSYAPWLRKNPHLLQPVITFITGSLSDPRLSPEAARALKE
ncbi:hypothetical protein HK102_012981, partial [Quaeritorhiza haematococci]